MTLGDLPALNATLNATSAVLLTLGYAFIRAKRVMAHRACMVSAFVVSSLFLISYVAYHLQAGRTKFAGVGLVRPVYFTILLTHTVLAMVIVPLVLTTLWHAVRGQFDQHKRIARWTLPIWFYVSITGVIIYFMLYHWYAPAAH
jgi:putative membrane protein